MSVQAITWVLEHSASSSNARCVLISIANHADREGANAWPSYDTIAREAGCSAATVKRVLVELRDSLGELAWLSNAGEEGARRKSNRYWLPKMRVREGLPADPPTRAQDEPPSRGRQRLRSKPTRAQNRRDKGSPLTQEPSLPVLNRGRSPEKPNPEGAKRARQIREAL